MNEITKQPGSNTPDLLYETIKNQSIENFISVPETVVNVSQTLSIENEFETISTKAPETTTPQSENITENEQINDSKYLDYNTQSVQKLETTSILFNQTLKIESTSSVTKFENLTVTLENDTSNELNVTESTFSLNSADLNESLPLNLTTIIHSNKSINITASSGIIPTSTELYASSLSLDNTKFFLNGSVSLKKNITIEMNENVVGKQVILTSDLSKHYQNGLVLWRRKYNQTLDLSLFIDLFSQTQVTFLFNF